MTATFIAFADPGALAEHVASLLVVEARAKKGDFVLALSGGSTPKMLYQLLATPRWVEQMPWRHVHLAFGDERFVAHDHPASNYRMVREALLAHAPIPRKNVHPIPAQGSPAAAAEDYQKELQRLYGAATLDPQRPLFDFTLLGLGEDGHTASLFPCVPALEEQVLWTAAVVGAKPEARITLTFPALNSSAAVVFLVAGARKHAMLQRFRARDRELPASRVEPSGALYILADEAAASGRAQP